MIAMYVAMCTVIRKELVYCWYQDCCLSRDSELISE